MTDFKLLEKLCTVEGISGDEGSVREIIINEIKPFADEIKTDNLGNIIVFKKGKNRAKAKLMLSAHMDEVGFMVTDITSDGYLKFDEVGGLDRRVVLGKTVTVGKNKVNGVIGVKPVHLSSGDERTAVPKLSEMYIDIGAESKDDALSVVSYGDSVNFNSIYENNGYTIKSKAIDDRFGCLALIELIKSELEYDMHFVFAVQEEVGLREEKHIGEETGQCTTAHTDPKDAAAAVYLSCSIVLSREGDGSTTEGGEQEIAVGVEVEGDGSACNRRRSIAVDGALDKDVAQREYHALYACRHSNEKDLAQGCPVDAKTKARQAEGAFLTAEKA